MDPTTSEELKQGTLTAPMELQMSVKEENYRTARSLKGIVMKVSQRHCSFAMFISLDTLILYMHHFVRHVIECFIHQSNGSK